MLAENVSILNNKLPDLASNLAQPERVAGMLAQLFGQCSGLAARMKGKLIGYIGWYLVADFRDTGRLGAYVPEWGHYAVSEHLPQIYQAFYNQAAAIWTSAGVQVHAITLLAHNLQEREFWFWNGFGLIVMDGIRPMQPLQEPATTSLSIRKAQPADSATLAELDEEHCRYYTQPPVLMARREATSVDAFAEFIRQPENAVWLAWDGQNPAGFLRFDGYEVEAATILEGEATAFISGAYVRSAYRSRGAARAMLDAALSDYAGRGYRRCVLDFETFNPYARSFWLKYFQPAAYSLMRVPEAIGDQSG